MTIADCPMCKVIHDPKVQKLYEDNDAVAMVNRMPSTVGHVLLMPKEHFPILEQVPDLIVAHLFTISNKLSSVLFETLGVQGTNILIFNGIAAGQELPHLVIHIIGRSENDGLDFAWQPKQISEEEMGSVEIMLKEEAKEIGHFESEKEKPIILDEREKIKKIKSGKDEVNYLIKHIQRIP